MRLGRLAPPAPGEIYQPDTRLRVGVGLAVRGGTASGGAAKLGEDASLAMSVKKKWALAKQQDVVRGRLVLRSYSQLSLGASYEYDLRRERVSARQQGGGGVRGCSVCVCVLRGWGGWRGWGGASREVCDGLGRELAVGGRALRTPHPPPPPTPTRAPPLARSGAARRRRSCRRLCSVSATTWT